jgi:sterol desaturase/sphingolipid hydroxylase (fatty acid hydroxylase superfamily)
MNPLDVLTAWFDTAQGWLFETLVQPVLYGAGQGNYLSEAYDGTGWLLVGLLQLLVLLAVIGPLQRWRPIEAPPGDAAQRSERRHAIAMDVIYTLLHRLGVLRVVLFFSVDPLFNDAFGWLAVQGVDGWHLDQWIAPLWPGVTDTALVGFLIYLLVFDFVIYGLHRAQHQWEWWWALHAVHHSQRHMTMWTDSRNHLLDTLLVDMAFVLVARVIGVPPGQFVFLVALSQLIESLSHANARLSFGWLGARLLVGPSYHRLHHGIGIGHENHGSGTLGGHNFSILFPIWDILFGTARFEAHTSATGIRDQLPHNGQPGRDYGRGFWAQQRLGLLRMIGRA